MHINWLLISSYALGYQCVIINNLNCLFQEVQLTLEHKVTHSGKALYRNRTHKSGYRIVNVKSPSLWS